MKILWISHFLPHPPHGGALQRNSNILRELSKRHEVTLVTFTQKVLLNSTEAEQEAINAVKPLCTELQVFSVPADQNVWRWYLLLAANVFSLTPYSVWRFRSRAMAGAIKQVCAKTTFDAVLIDTIALGDYFDCVGAAPIVLNHHNVESMLLARRSRIEKNIFTRLYVWLQAVKLKRYERIKAKQAALNVLVSETDLEVLQNLQPLTKGIVVPNGTDTNYFSPSAGDEVNNIIFAGGMTWYPNKDAVLYFCREVFPLIKQRVPAVRFLIAGGSPPKELDDFHRDDPAICPLGFVDDVRPFILGAAVYVVPIRVGGGTRLKILDAMSLGKAIVSTTVGAEGIAVKNGNDIVFADDAREFAEAVVALLKDPERRKLLGAAARNTAVKLYSWQTIVPKLEQGLSGIARR